MVNCVSMCGGPASEIKELTPPFVAGDSKARDAGRSAAGEGYLLLNAEGSHEGFGSVRHRSFGIADGVFGEQAGLTAWEDVTGSSSAGGQEADGGQELESHVCNADVSSCYCDYGLSGLRTFCRRAAEIMVIYS